MFAAADSGMGSKVIHYCKCVIFTQWRELCREKLYIHGMLTFIVTFLIILPMALHNTRCSLLFLRPKKEISEQTEKELNTQRAATSQRYLETLPKLENKNMLQSLSSGRSNQLDVMIMIVAMSRVKLKDTYEAKYLTQTVSRFLMMLHAIHMSNDFPYSVAIAVCNVDIRIRKFQELQIIRGVVNVTHRFQYESQKIQNKKVKNNTLEKEKQDYVFCLNESLTKQHPRYVLMVEDDALPKDNFFQVLRNTIDMHLDRQYKRGIFQPANNNTLYVKFYHPERLLGYYSIEPERLTELYGLSALCGTFAYYLITALMTVKRNHFRKLWLFCVAYFALVFITIGRSNVNLFREMISSYRLHTFSPAPSCCTPAMLFPRSGAETVVSYLSSVQCKKGFGKDTALDQLIRREKKNAYLVQPNTFQHIGMYSTLRKTIIDPSVM